MSKSAVFPSPPAAPSLPRPPPKPSTTQQPIAIAFPDANQN